ncbi:MAG: hypothetical protein WEB88_05395 [Gemmatimonadota bacterium]
MRIHANVTDLIRNFSAYVNRVVYRREHFVIVRGGKPVAELSPVPTATRLGDLPALLGSLPRLDQTEASSLAEDLASARTELEAREPEDRWES